MDPASAVVMALGAGAAALANGILGEAATDIYNALKAAVVKLVNPGDVEQLVAKPQSESRQGVIAEQLVDAGKSADPELVVLAQRLLKAIPPEQLATGDIRFKNIEAANVTLERLSASGNVAIENVKAAGDFRATDIAAGKK